MARRASVSHQRTPGPDASISMIGTLQRYVARELTKTFALTAVGLAMTFSLCGGVVQMIEADVLNAVQFFRIMGFVFRLSMTLTLPVAALFACAIVYGRLAADNEFDACRASGINILRLLAPAVGLSLFTAAFTFSFINYVLPEAALRIEALVRQDLQKFVTQNLQQVGHLRRGPYVLYADLLHSSKPAPGRDEVRLRGVAFYELENENVMRCGTAEEIIIDFSTESASGDPIVRAVMFDVLGVDLARYRVYEWPKQPIDPVQISSRIKLKPKWLNLSELLHASREPTDLPMIRDKLPGLRGLVRDAMLYAYAYRHLTPAGTTLLLEGGGQRLEIRAENVDQDREDFKPRLRKVTASERSAEQNRDYTAELGSVRIRRGVGTSDDMVQFTLENATLTDLRDASKTIQKPKVDLFEMPLPREVVDYEAALTEHDLLRRDVPLGGTLPPLDLGYEVEDARIAMRKDIAKLQIDIVGIIHSRLAFSASVLVMLVLAAALGIIFRGGQLLTAFVIAFIPGLLVVVMNIMGRQLAENTNMHLVGLAVIWSAIVLVAAADAVVLSLYLKR